MPTNYKKRLEDAWKSYLGTVEREIRLEFNFEIKPFINEYHLEFCSGMGDWWINYTDKTPEWFIKAYQDNYFKGGGGLDKSKLPEKIVNILDHEIEGLPYNNLGSYHPEYKGE